MKLESKRISKKASLVVMGIATLGIMGASAIGVSAMSSSSGDGLAARLATKFNLNKDEVSAEIKSYHDEKHGEREANIKAEISANLQKKVDDGSITAEQKTAIEAKLEEIRLAREAEREANKESDTKPSRDEMEAKRDQYKSEMDAWLKEQGINIDLKDVLPTHGDRGRGMKGGKRD
jgi:hypothetical protein